MIGCGGVERTSPTGGDAAAAAGSSSVASGGGEADGEGGAGGRGGPGGGGSAGDACAPALVACGEARCHLEQACVDGACRWPCVGVAVPGDFMTVRGGRRARHGGRDSVRRSRNIRRDGHRRAGRRPCDSRRRRGGDPDRRPRDYRRQGHGRPRGTRTGLSRGGERRRALPTRCSTRATRPCLRWGPPASMPAIHRSARGTTSSGPSGAAHRTSDPSKAVPCRAGDAIQKRCSANLVRAMHRRSRAARRRPGARSHRQRRPGATQCLRSRDHHRATPRPAGRMGPRRMR